MENRTHPETGVPARQRHDGNRPDLSANSKDADTNGDTDGERALAVNRLALRLW